MLILDSSADIIQAVLGGAVTTNQPHAFSSYVTFQPSAYVAGSTAIALNDTTDVTIVPAPSSGQRQVKSISIFNRDTVAVTVTVKLDVSGTEFTLCRAVLAANEALQYQDGEGWTTLDSSGNRKTVTT